MLSLYYVASAPSLAGNALASRPRLARAALILESCTRKKAPPTGGAFSKFCRKQDEILFVYLDYKHEILQALKLLRAASTGELVGAWQVVRLRGLLILERID